jgi:hypothetical protein
MVMGMSEVVKSDDTINQNYLSYDFHPPLEEKSMSLKKLILASAAAATVAFSVSVLAQSSAGVRAVEAGQKAGAVDRKAADATATTSDVSRGEANAAMDKAVEQPSRGTFDDAVQADDQAKADSRTEEAAYKKSGESIGKAVDAQKKMDAEIKKNTDALIQGMPK